MKIDTEVEEVGDTTAKSDMTAMLSATRVTTTILVLQTDMDDLTGTMTAIIVKAMIATTRTGDTIMTECTKIDTTIMIVMATSGGQAQRADTKEGLNLNKELHRVATHQSVKEARAANTHPPERVLLLTPLSSILLPSVVVLGKTLMGLKVLRMLG